MNETNDAITSNATLEGFELPLMPLREVVMSPHSIMPLLVGREASIKAIESAVNDYGKRICLVTQREPELEKPDPADLYAVGVVGRVLQYMRLPEGPIKVLFEGLYRISWRPLTPEDQENPFGTDAFPKVVVTPLPIMRNDGPETEALVRATKEILAEYAIPTKNSLRRSFPPSPPCAIPDSSPTPSCPCSKSNTPKNRKRWSWPIQDSALKRFTSS